MNNNTIKQKHTCPICDYEDAKMWYITSSDSYGLDDMFVECDKCKKTYIKKKDFISGMIEVLAAILNRSKKDIWEEHKGG